MTYKKQLFNAGIAAGFLCVFYIYVKAADTISVEYAIKTCEKEDNPVMAEGMTKGNPMVRVVNDVIPYYIPLDETAERIEWAYIYGNTWDYRGEYEYDELGYLPQGEKIPLTVYLAEGSRILFLPEGIRNKTVWLNNELCDLYYSEQSENYLFYSLAYVMAEEGGTPVNTFECCCISTKRVKIDSLIKLGEVEVTFDPEERAKMLPIQTDRNEYIEAAVKQIQEILSEREIYGEFQMYIEEYGRIQANHYDLTDCTMTGCIVGDGVEQYFEFMIHDHEQISGVWMPGGQPPISSEAYFSYASSAYINKICQRIRETGREPVSFQVVEGTDYTEQDIQWEESDQNYNYEVNFSDMDAEEAGKYLSYVLSYSEWFGMNELGYGMGMLMGLDQKEVIIYLGEDGGFSFVPKEDINTVVESGEGKEYPLYVNENGYAELYELSRNPYAILDGQLKLCMVHEVGEVRLSDENIEKMMERYGKTVGETTITITDLPVLGVPEVEEDEYVLALEDHVKDLLEQSGKHGGYRIYIGEYEAGVSRNKVCLSAAVSGEGEEYYVRYLIVKSQTGKYYFWPTGFGLNGSLEECAADRHYMNRLCIERTKQLERSGFEITIP